MHLASRMEEKQEGAKTFDLDYAVNLLACSLPYSSLTILILFNFGDIFSLSWVLPAVGASLVGLSFLFARWSDIRKGLASLATREYFPSAGRPLGEMRDSD